MYSQIEERMKWTSVMLSLLVTVAVASYWHNEVNSVMSRYADRGLVQQANRADCAIVYWSEDKLNNGFTVEDQAVHVCADKYSRGGLCYFTKVLRCCSHTGLEQEVVSHRRTIGSQSIKISILYAGHTDVCVYFDPRNAIDPCPTGFQCIDRGCLKTVQTCINNSLSNCDPSGCMACKQGYKKLSCCECEDNYLKDNGVCKFVCQPNCRGARGHCRSCSHPYTNAPFCCDCLPPYVKKNGEDGVCVCPDGYYDVGGTCERICTENTVSCANPPCCKTGFKAPLCCECIFDAEDSFFKINGQCKRICTENTFKQNCNVNTGCSLCEDSFKPPDCCECKEPLQLIDGVCRHCRLDEALVDGRCKAICGSHVIPETCDGTRCQCLTGYLPNDCCNCAPGYILKGELCRKCPPGTTPDSTKTICICDPSKGRLIYVDGKCTLVCDRNVVKCSESNCTCHHFFASPDCCNCITGDEPKNGKCPVPCIDNQNIVIVMDRSSGIGQTELWGTMYMIEILTSALLRGTRKLVVSVISYAISLQDSQLMDLTPRLFTGKKEVDENFCTKTLKRYERNMKNVKIFPRPLSTHSGWTMHLLNDFIQKDTKTTVITFAGTISNGNSLNLIANGIREIKTKVGSSNVQFFAAGFEAENLYKGDVRRMKDYYAEVKALGSNNSSQSVVVNIETNAAGFMRAVTDMLYNSGVLCKHQRDDILSVGSDSAINSLFYDYEKCVVTTTTPCITLPQYNYVCLTSKTDNTKPKEDNESSFLAAVHEGIS